MIWDMVQQTPHARLGAVLAGLSNNKACDVFAWQRSGCIMARQAERGSVRRGAGGQVPDITVMRYNRIRRGTSAVVGKRTREGGRAEANAGGGERRYRSHLA